MSWLKARPLPSSAEDRSGGEAAGRPVRRPYIDRLVYAVGDVHGRADLFARLLQAIHADVRELDLMGRPTLVLLGDYVDRGPDARGVLELILGLQRGSDFDLLALKGNHEAALLKFLRHAEYGLTWARFGGLETLASYGVEGPRLMTDAAGWAQTQAGFVDRLPPDHLRLLWSLPPMAIIGDYAFVHAGVDPGRPIAEQDEHDMLWIRDPFLDDDTALEKVVVHGHTPETEPFNGRRRIGVDTGAYTTGVLTAIRLLGASRTFLQTRS